LGKGDVRGVVEVVLGERLPKPTRREEVALRWGSKLKVAQGAVYISRPKRSLIRHAHGVGAAAGNSDHAWEEFMYILRKIYFTRYGRAQEAF
jgi:hypothetical protein